MADPADLTTLSDLKAWLSIPLSTTTDDALLTRLITAASKYIQSWLNRTIASATYNETRDGNGGTRMLLGNYPVTGVAALSIDGIAISPSAGPGQPGYVFNQYSISLIGYRFTRDYSNVAITYTAGYSSVPQELAQACIEMISLRYKERDRIGLVSKGLAGETTAFSQKDMPASVQTILGNYKRVVPW